MNIINVMLIVFGLWLLQGVFSYFQVRNYRETVGRLKVKGRLLIAREKGRFKAGIIMIMAVDDKGIIVAAEEMKGITVFHKFRKLESVIGKSIYEDEELLNSLESKLQREAIIGALEGVWTEEEAAADQNC